MFVEDFIGFGIGIRYIFNIIIDMLMWFSLTWTVVFSVSIRFGKMIKIHGKSLSSFYIYIYI